MFNGLTSGSRRHREQTSWVLSTKATCWFREARANSHFTQETDGQTHRPTTLNQTCHKNNAESNESAHEQTATNMMKQINGKRANSSAIHLAIAAAAADTSRAHFSQLDAAASLRERLEQTGGDKLNLQNCSSSPMETHVRRCSTNKTTNTNKTTTAPASSRVRFRSEAPKWFERAAWLTATICVLLVMGQAVAVTGQEAGVRAEAGEQQVASEQQQVAGTSAGERIGLNEETQQQKVPLDDAQLSSEANPSESSASAAAAPIDQTSSTSQQAESAGSKSADSERGPESGSGQADTESTATTTSTGQQQQQQQQSAAGTPNSGEQVDSQQPQAQVQSDEVASVSAAPQDVQESEQSVLNGSQQQQQPNMEGNQARVVEQSNEQQQQQQQQQRTTTFDNDLPPIASQFSGSGESRFGAKQTATKQVDRSEPMAVISKTGSRQLKRAQAGNSSVFGRKRANQAESNQAASRPASGNRRAGERQQIRKQNQHHHYYYQTVNQNQNQNQAGSRQGRAQTQLKQADFPDYKEILVQPENVGAAEYEAQRRPVESQQSSAPASDQQQQQLDQQTSLATGGSSLDHNGFELSQQQQQQQQPGTTAQSEQVAATSTPPGPYIRLSNIATINSNTTSGGANSSSPGGGGGSQPSEMKLMRIYVIDLDQKLVVGPNAYGNGGETNVANEQQRSSANVTGAQVGQSPLDSSESAHIEQTKVEVGEGSNSDEQLVQQHPYNEQLAHMMQTQQSSNVYTTSTSMAPHGGEPAAVVEQYHRQQYLPQQQRPQTSPIDANAVRLNPAEFVLVDRDSLQANLSQLVAAMGQANAGAHSSLPTGYHYRHYLQQSAAGDNHQPSGSAHQLANYEPSQTNGHLANNGTAAAAAAAATTSTTSTSALASASATYNTNSRNQYLGPFNKQGQDEQSQQAQLDPGPGNSARATSSSSSSSSSSNQLLAGADNGNQSLSVAYPQFMEAAHGQFAAVNPAPKQHHQHHHQQQLQQQSRPQPQPPHQAHQLQQLLQQPVPQYTAPQYTNSSSNGSAPQSALHDKQQVSAGQYSTSAGNQLGQHDETGANYTARVHSPALNPAEPSTGQQQQPQPQLDKYQAPARGAVVSANLYAAQPPDYSMYQQEQQQPQQQQQQHPIPSLSQVYEAHSEPGQRQHNEPIQKSPAEFGPYFGQAQTPAKVTSEAKLLALHQSDQWKPVDFASPVAGGVSAPQQAQAQVNFYAQKSAAPARLNGRQPADHDIVSLSSRQRNYLATNPSDRQHQHQQQQQQQQQQPYQNGSAASDVQHASGGGGASLPAYVNIEQQHHSRPSGGEFAPSQQVHAHPSSSLSSHVSLGYSSEQGQTNGTAAGLTLTGVTNEYGGGGGGGGGAGGVRYSRTNASQIAADSEEAPKIPRAHSFAASGSYRRPGGESQSSPYAFQEASGGGGGGGGSSDPADSDSDVNPAGGSPYGAEVSSSGHELASNKYNNSSRQTKSRPQRPKARPKKLAPDSIEAVAQFGEQSNTNSYGQQQQQLDLPLRNHFLQEGAGSYSMGRPNSAHGPNALRPNYNNPQPYANQFRPGLAAKGLLSWQTISSVASGAAKRIPGALSSILSPFGMGSAMRQQSAAINYPTAQSASYQQQQQQQQQQQHVMPNLPSNFAKQAGASAHLASIYQQPPYPFRHMTPPESYTDSTASVHNHAQELAEAGGEIQESADEATSGEETNYESDDSPQVFNQSESSEPSKELGSSLATGMPIVTVSVGAYEQEAGGDATNSTGATKGEVIGDLAEISADGKAAKTTRQRGGGGKAKLKATRAGTKAASKGVKLAKGAELEAAQAAVLSSIEQELEQQDEAQKQTRRKPAKKTRQPGRPNGAPPAANFGGVASPSGNHLMPYQTNEALSLLGVGGGVAPPLGALRTGGGGGGGSPALTGLQIGQYKIVPQTQFVQSIIEPSRQMLGQYFKQYIGQLGQLG